MVSVTSIDTAVQAASGGASIDIKPEEVSQLVRDGTPLGFQEMTYGRILVLYNTPLGDGEKTTLAAHTESEVLYLIQQDAKLQKELKVLIEQGFHLTDGINEIQYHA